MAMAEEEIEEFEKRIRHDLEERIRHDLERDYYPDDYKRLIEKYERIWPGLFLAIKMKIGNIMAEQVAVVGSERIYQRIHKTFLEENFEPLFAKEQIELYKWREDFFCNNFPFPDEVGSNWYTTDPGDSHFYYTLPFNITKHFDRVVALACIPPWAYNLTINPDGKVWFDDGGDGVRINNLDYWRWAQFDKDFLEETGLGYSDAAHVIVSLHQTGPLKLEHLAMKKVLEYQIPLDEVPNEVKIKAAVGMFDGTEDIPDYISDEGREAYEDLRREFGFTD